MPSRDIFECISPLDYRYYDPEAAKMLSEEAFIQAKLKVELALVKNLCMFHICTHEVVNEVERAIQTITVEEVYAEERRIGHDIRALANLIRARVSDACKPYVHFTATSYDIVDTATALRFAYFGHFMSNRIDALITILSRRVREEANTLQVARTHGQHAVPFTFGFCLAGYASRLAYSSRRLGALARDLRGKFSGAVGTYNASSLFVNDPEAFEDSLLSLLGLQRAEHSTQIVQPEFLIRFLSEFVLVAGILGNMADDLRHLQRTEIDEVREATGKDQVGSSTMAQKRNPIGTENIKSMWKIVLGRMATVYMDQISEHQRDLTNSASSRTYVEIMGYAAYMVKRMIGIIDNLQIDRERMLANLSMTGDAVVAEALYLGLASVGHPDAHDAVRVLSNKARIEGRSLFAVMESDPGMQVYIGKLPESVLRAIKDPSTYIGLASELPDMIIGRIQNGQFE